MRILKIEEFYENYSIEFNNCIDSNIAAMTSYFQKSYLKFYCVYWSLFANWTFVENIYELRDKILDRLGLTCNYLSVESSEIIKKIKQLIYEGYPAMLLVTSASLFYSIRYKDNLVNFINHSIIINGIDEKKELIYILDNSLHKEIIEKLTKTLKLIPMQLPFQIIQDICELNKEILNMNENKNTLMFISCNYPKEINEIRKTLFNDVRKIFCNKQDILIEELNSIVKNNDYVHNIDFEQFRRTYLLSLTPLFEYIEGFILEENKTEFIDIKNSFLKNRCKTINLIVKFSLNKNEKFYEVAKDLVFLIKSDNEKMQKFLENTIKNIEYASDKENLLYKDGTEIISDSCLIPNYSVENLKLNLNYNLDEFVWVSDIKTKNHWVIIKFNDICEISRIVLEHSKYLSHVTKSFKILYSCECNDWNEIIEEFDNKDSINDFAFQPIKCKFLKIEIYDPSRVATNKAILRRVYIY